MRVDIENGKYTYVSHDSGSELLRHGEFWQDVTGQKVWYCAAYELQEAREERDALAAHKMAVHKLTGLPASVGVCEPIEGFAERPQDLVPAVRDMALRIKDLETERDAAVSTQDEMALAMFDINKARAVAEGERNALEAKWKNTGLPGRYEALNDGGHRLLGSREAVEHFRAQFSALAAHVERLTSWIKENAWHRDDCDLLDLDEEGRHKACSCGLRSVYEAPETSLARLIAEKQAEALEELYRKVEGYPAVGRSTILNYAVDLRRQAGGDA